MHNKESQKYFPPGDFHKDHGKYYPNSKIDELSDYQSAPVEKRFRHFTIGQVTFGVPVHLLKIRGNRPIKGKKAIEQKGIVVLKSMVPVPFRMFGESKDTACFQILVMVMDIGIGMVQDIVLYLPVVYIPGQDIDTAPHNFIDPIFIGICPVITI